MRYSIGIWDSGLPFSAKTPMKDLCLGGSETAIWQLARELASRGHEIHFCHNALETGKIDHTNVWDHSAWQRLSTQQEFDVVIVNRDYFRLSAQFRTQQCVLWNHDIAPTEVEAKHDFIARTYKLDRMYVNSQYHGQLYRTMEPAATPASWDPILRVTRNGLDLDLIRESTKGVKPLPNRVVYTSRPERGLYHLLTEVWPALLDREPELELFITSYQVDDNRLPPQIRALYTELDKILAQTPNVTKLPPLTKSLLYKLYASSSVLLYPCTFPEIFCISALEAIACGCIPVTTNGFALPETIGPCGVLIDGRPGQKDYTEALVAQAHQTLAATEPAKSYRANAAAWVQQFSWSTIAEEWERDITEEYDRWATRSRNICQRLVWNSDYVQGRRYASEHLDTCADLYEYTNTVVRGLESDIFESDPDNCYAPDEVNQFLANDTWRRQTRFIEMVKRMPDETKSILDVGSHLGVLFAIADLRFNDPNLKMVGVECSPGLVKDAKRLCIETMKHPGCTEFRLGRLETINFKDEQYDVVCCGETLEHLLDPEGFVDQLEDLCRPGGTMVFTVPSGPMESQGWTTTKYYHPFNEGITYHPVNSVQHINHFTRHDLESVFGKKRAFTIDLLFLWHNHHNEFVGQWVFSYRKDERRLTGTRNYQERIYRTRPYEPIGLATMIKNEEDHILPFLKSVAFYVDEIVLYDTGSTDQTLSLAAHFADERFKPVIKWVNGYLDTETGFAGARNRSIAELSADCQWVLMGDADERLYGGHFLRQLVYSPMMPGYVIEQPHLIYDLPKQKADQPVRLFKRQFQYWGLIHETPQRELNEPLNPAIVAPRMAWLHYGYPIDQVRREKVARNMKLLLEDRKRNPDRIIGAAYICRDFVTLADAYLVGNKYTPEGLKFLREVVRCYYEVFAALEFSPNSVYYEYWRHAFPFYQEALSRLGARGQTGFFDDPSIPFEIALGLAGGLGGLSINGNFEHDRRWFVNTTEFTRWFAHQGKELADRLQRAQEGNLL